MTLRVSETATTTSVTFHDADTAWCALDSAWDHQAFKDFVSADLYEIVGDFQEEFSSFATDTYRSYNDYNWGDDDFTIDIEDYDDEDRRHTQIIADASLAQILNLSGFVLRRDSDDELLLVSLDSNGYEKETYYLGIPDQDEDEDDDDEEEEEEGVENDFISLDLNRPRQAEVVEQQIGPETQHAIDALDWLGKAFNVPVKNEL